MTEEESIEATKFGFVVINFLNGAKKAMAVSDVKGCGTRGSDRSIIRLRNDHAVLVGVPFAEVLKAIASASGEGCHAAS
jgi:hypothetical protein